jgi:hypothetical protein
MSTRSASGFIDSGEAAVVKAECDLPGFYVKRVTIAADGEDDLAILSSKCQDDDDSDIRMEQASTLIPIGGKEVVIEGDAGSGTKQVIFYGRVMDVRIRGQGRDEEIEVTVLGLKHELKTEKLFGCYSRTSDDTAQWLQAIPLVFNPDGKPNKNKDDLADPSTSKNRVVFNHDPGHEDSELWTAAAMFRYCATGERKATVRDTTTAIFETTDEPGGELAKFKPLDVNCEEEDIWSALMRIAHRCGHSIVMKYGQSREDATIKVFPRSLGQGAEAKQFEFPAAGGAIQINSRSKLVSSVDVQRDYAGMVTDADVIAPPKLWESKWELKQGWLLDDEDEAFGTGTAAEKMSRFLRETDPRHSTDWERFKNVGRRWILNETGRDQTVEGEEADPFDFSDVFGIEKYCERFRPFRRDRPTKEEDTDQPSAPLLHVTWGSSTPVDIEVGGAVRLLKDRAGIYFTRAPLILPSRFLESGTKGDLFPEKVEITAAVEGDQAAPHGIFAGKGNDNELPQFGVVRLDDGARVDNINEEDATAVEEAAQDLVDQVVEDGGEPREVGTIVCPYVSNQFQVGDYIDEIEGRGIALKALIMKVTWDFFAQSTEYALQDPFIDTEAHAVEKRNVDPGDVDAHGDQNSGQIADLLGHTMMGHGPLKIPGSDRTVAEMLEDELRAFEKDVR